jgi:hypothetical protein
MNTQIIHGQTIIVMLIRYTWNPLKAFAVRKGNSDVPVCTMQQSYTISVVSIP